MAKPRHIAREPVLVPAPARRAPMDLVALAVVAVIALLAAGFWLSQPQSATSSATPTAQAPVLSTPLQPGLSKAQLVELALKHPDVQSYAARNAGYFVEDKLLTSAELSEEAQRYPVIYEGLQYPTYQLRFSSSTGEGLLVLLNSRGVQRVFAVQSLRVG